MTGIGSWRPSIPARVREGDGLPTCIDCDVPGLDGGPFEPCVHVRVRLGRCRRVLGRFWKPMRNKGVLGLSSSSGSLWPEYVLLLGRGILGVVLALCG